MLDAAFYKLADPNLWSGREDGSQRDSCRWHQIVQFADLNGTQNLHNAFVILGFQCDEGVRRNQGRIGAKDGAIALRKVLAGLPVHFSENRRLIDAGDIVCDHGDLEGAQKTLSDAVANILNQGGFPFVLGGGHEVTYGHFNGIAKNQQGNIGIINIDAHLDIRPTVNGVGNSGTGLYQIEQGLSAQHKPFHYLAIGIQQISNTQALLKYAKNKGVQIIEAKDLRIDKIDSISQQILDFAQSVDHVYLTIDMDAFAAPYAPGVSALAFNGIIPDRTFRQLYSVLSKLPNVVSVDIAELNPTYDIDNRTSRLAADLVFTWCGTEY